ncbi:YpsA SLOG family protein [Sorangium sp. So ce406]|uniref:YpsA SLOG family protein n=1 Tax=Sorangium sp. So ce406 TaxID=3133311 RepID=UPI003F5AE7A4
MPRISIVSGGQTGVDRAALDVAIAHRIPYSGWCPLGGRAEDFPHPSGLTEKYVNLHQTPAQAAEQRTAWNVRDSNATLIIVDAARLNDRFEFSEGTLFTKICADLIFMRPCHVVGLDGENSLATALHWLTNQIEAFPINEFRLNFAGPRESEANGIYARASVFISDLLERVWSEARAC